MFVCQKTVHHARKRYISIPLLVCWAFFELIFYRKKLAEKKKKKTPVYVPFFLWRFRRVADTFGLFCVWRTSLQHNWGNRYAICQLVSAVGHETVHRVALSFTNLSKGARGEAGVAHVSLILVVDSPFCFGQKIFLSETTAQNIFLLFNNSFHYSRPRDCSFFFSRARFWVIQQYRPSSTRTYFKKNNLALKKKK